MSTVTEHLSDEEIEFTAYDHARTYTSIDEARALGIHADEVIKTVVLDTVRGHALAVIPCADRLDMHRVRFAVHDPHARLADEEELERDFPAFELGAIPPIAALVDMPIYIDPIVPTHDHVVFASGKQTESVRMRTKDLLGDRRVSIVPLRAKDGADVAV